MTTESASPDLEGTLSRLSHLAFLSNSFAKKSFDSMQNTLLHNRIVHSKDFAELSLTKIEDARTIISNRLGGVVLLQEMVESEDVVWDNDRDAAKKVLAIAKSLDVAENFVKSVLVLVDNHEEIAEAVRYYEDEII